MAGGWSNDGAVQEQIDSTIEDAVQRARSQLPVAEPDALRPVRCTHSSRDVRLYPAA